jgi:hypothetical protein
MHNRRLTFVLFAGAILFSMVREWSAPVSCALTNFPLSVSSAPSRQ